MIREAEAMAVRHVSKCIIKPMNNALEESELLCHLTPWDLTVLSVNYIQRGLLFTNPPPSGENNDQSTVAIIDHLKKSLSHTLTHFYPFTGRLVTKINSDPSSCHILLDCTGSPGVQFIHAVAEAITVADIISPGDVHPILESFFPFAGAVNHEGHSLPLLVVQVTELEDGIFVGCSGNHVVADGSSFWHFFNTWSEISRTLISRNSTSSSSGMELVISRPPITNRWFLQGQGPFITLPFSQPSEFIERYLPQPHRERFFHFTAQGISRLKEKANADEWHNTARKISSFQALAAVVWRSITRARRLSDDQITNCYFPINNRLRLNPPLSVDYFGNCIQAVGASVTAGELLSNSLGWSAQLLHQVVVGHTDANARAWLEAWVKSPMVYQFGQFVDNRSVMFGSSPRFDMYGNDFGWGKPVAARSGYGNKFDGKVTMYPGRDGGGSIDLEVCLVQESMAALELDAEFMEAASLSEVY